MTTQGFGKVGVLFGGNSAERAISLRSGNAVLAALQSQGVDAIGIDINFDGQLIEQLQGIDRAFIALHGRGGEDGIIQAVLNVLDIPYTGSGVMASALAMDKLRTKQLWLGAGLSTPEFFSANEEEELEGVLEKLGGTVMVKPPHEGSSIGMSKVSTNSELFQAFAKAQEHDSEVLVERWIYGEEYTCAILNGKALPAIRLKTPNDFYDFQAKYESNETQYLCPCGLDNEAETELQQLSLNAFRAVGCRGWGRVDAMRDQTGKFWLLEVNTVPGMTDHSLVPMAAKTAGLDFPELVKEILKCAEIEA
ncbi:MAG: D-alanine--D-alanine ligase [Pseudomonadales bacterium]|nr:D-alanine--D-alanine ligase [Pseudomonadales bacterium]